MANFAPSAPGHGRLWYHQELNNRVNAFLSNKYYKMQFKVTLLIRQLSKISLFSEIYFSPGYAKNNEWSNFARFREKKSFGRSKSQLLGQLSQIISLSETIQNSLSCKIFDAFIILDIL